jgi:hypothetical protein
LPFERQNITFESPKAMSRTDFAMKITYVFDNKEMNVISKEMKRVEYKDKLENNCSYLLLNSEKAFNNIIAYVLRHYYKKLKITSPVNYITNVSAREMKVTQKFIEVSYRISSRDA